MDCVVNKWKDVILGNYSLKKSLQIFLKALIKFSISRDLVVGSYLLIPDLFFE